MAVSTSKLKIAKAKESVAEGLARQTQKLKEVPWWKTLGSMALPVLSSMAMGPLGGFLTQLGGGAGALGSLFGGGKLATTIAQGLGKGLEFAGAGLGKAKAGTGILKNLGQTGIKALYNLGAQKLGKGALNLFDKRSEKDLFIEGGPLEQALGKDALKKLRGDWRSAKKAEGDMDVAGSILSAFAQQGTGMYGDKLKDYLGGLLPKEWSPAFKEAQKSGAEAREKLAFNKAFGIKSSQLQKLAGGEKVDLDKLVDPLTGKIDSSKSRALQERLGIRPSSPSNQALSYLDESTRQNILRGKTFLQQNDPLNILEQSRTMPTTFKPNILEGLISPGRKTTSFPLQTNIGQAIGDVDLAQEWANKWREPSAIKGTRFENIMKHLIAGRGLGTFSGGRGGVSDEDIVSQLLSAYYERGQ